MEQELASLKKDFQETLKSVWERIGELNTEISKNLEANQTVNLTLAEKVDSLEKEVQQVVGLANDIESEMNNLDNDSILGMALSDHKDEEVVFHQVGGGTIRGRLLAIDRLAGRVLLHDTHKARWYNLRHYDMMTPVIKLVKAEEE